MGGFVYVMSNESFPGVIKIGMTRDLPQQRAAALSNTSVPFPFVVEFAVFCSEPSEIEQYAHDQLNGYRCATNREFFRLDVEVAVKCILSNIVSEYFLEVGYDGMFISDQGFSAAVLRGVIQPEVGEIASILLETASDEQIDAAKALRLERCRSARNG